jgi:hypothetical protein
MDEFVNYLSEIDPDFKLVQQESFNDTDRIKEYYMNNWK